MKIHWLIPIENWYLQRLRNSTESSENWNWVQWTKISCWNMWNRRKAQIDSINRESFQNNRLQLHYLLLPFRSSRIGCLWQFHALIYDFDTFTFTGLGLWSIIYEWKWKWIKFCWLLDSVKISNKKIKKKKCWLIFLKSQIGISFSYKMATDMRW